MAMVSLLRCRLWVEWIDSNSNHADGLSRQGLAEPLFGTIASMASFSTWQSPADFSLSDASRSFRQVFPPGHYSLLCTLVFTLGVVGLGSRVVSLACRYFRIPTCITCKRRRLFRITEVHAFPRLTEEKNCHTPLLCAPLCVSVGMAGCNLLPFMVKIANNLSCPDPWPQAGQRGMWCRRVAEWVRQSQGGGVTPGCIPALATRAVACFSTACAAKFMIPRYIYVGARVLNSHVSIL